MLSTPLGQVQYRIAFHCVAQSNSVDPMELHQVRAFLAVAEELHFGRAATRLHMAQPPLSRTIRQLERGLGAQLFERTTRSVRLTSAGEALIAPAHAVLQSFQTAARAVQAAVEGETGQVRLAFAGPSSHMLIGTLARRVRAEHPGIELKLHSVTYASQGLQQVQEGALDLAIVRWDIAPEGIESRVLALERNVIVVPSDHALGGRVEVSLAELRDEAWVSLPGDPGSHLHTSFLRHCQAAGYAPRIVQAAPDSWTIMALVAAGAGITFTLDTVVEHIPKDGLVVLPLREPLPPVEARLAWRAHDSSAVLRHVLRVSETALPTP